MLSKFKNKTKIQFQIKSRIIFMLFGTLKIKEFHNKQHIVNCVCVWVRIIIMMRGKVLFV